MRELNPGQIYFMVQYNDQRLTKPMIESYEYIGKIEGDRDDPYHEFLILRSGSHTNIRESDLSHVVDISGLIDELSRFRNNGKGG